MSSELKWEMAETGKGTEIQLRSRGGICRGLIIPTHLMHEFRPKGLK